MSLKGWPTTLRDYQQPLSSSILAPDGRAGQDQATGPLVPPVNRPAEDLTPESLMRSYEQLLARLPFTAAMEFRRQLMLQSRDAVWFNRSADLTAVAAGATVQLVSQTIGERAVGILEQVGLICEPAAAMADLRWSVVINNSIHPKFGELVFPFTNYTTPRNFRMEIMGTNVVTLQVRNTSAFGVLATGVLVGWQEPLMDTKTFGSSPQGGIG